jgi:hypothetical protein
MSNRTDNNDGTSGRRGLYPGDGAGGPHHLSRDEELKALLNSWEAPVTSRSLDQRVMAAYRNRHSAPFWKRALFSSINVPVPVAAAVILLLFTSGFLALRLTRTSTSQEAFRQPPPEIRVIEVPVVQERVVTRTIYVDKTGGRRARPGKQAGGNQTAEVGNAAPSPARDEESTGKFFTRADLSGFEPVSQMRIEVIRGTKSDED